MASKQKIIINELNNMLSQTRKSISTIPVPINVPAEPLTPDDGAEIVQLRNMLAELQENINTYNGAHPKDSGRAAAKARKANKAFQTLHDRV